MSAKFCRCLAQVYEVDELDGRRHEVDVRGVGAGVDNTGVEVLPSSLRSRQFIPCQDVGLAAYRLDLP